MWFVRLKARVYVEKSAAGSVEISTHVVRTTEGASISRSADSEGAGSVESSTHVVRTTEGASICREERILKVLVILDNSESDQVSPIR